MNSGAQCEAAFGLFCDSDRLTENYSAYYIATYQINKYMDMNVIGFYLIIYLLIVLMLQKNTFEENSQLQSLTTRRMLELY